MFSKRSEKVIRVRTDLLNKKSGILHLMNKTDKSIAPSPRSHIIALFKKVSLQTSFKNIE